MVGDFIGYRTVWSSSTSRVRRWPSPVSPSCPATSITLLSAVRIVLCTLPVDTAGEQEKVLSELVHLVLNLYIREKQVSFQYYSVLQTLPVPHLYIGGREGGGSRLLLSTIIFSKYSIYTEGESKLPFSLSIKCTLIIYFCIYIYVTICVLQENRYQ